MIEGVIQVIIAVVARKPNLNSLTQVAALIVSASPLRRELLTT